MKNSSTHIRNCATRNITWRRTSWSVCGQQTKSGEDSLGMNRRKVLVRKGFRGEAAKKRSGPTLHLTYFPIHSAAGVPLADVPVLVSAERVPADFLELADKNFADGKGTQLAVLLSKSGYQTAETLKELLSTIFWPHLPKEVGRRGSKLGKRILLLLDWHVSRYSENMVPKLAEQNKTDLLLVPRRSTAFMQAGDVCLHGRFKAIMTQLKTEWFRRHPGEDLILRELLGLASIAWKRALTKRVISGSWKRAGLSPLSRVRPLQALASSSDHTERDEIVAARSTRSAVAVAFGKDSKLPDKPQLGQPVHELMHCSKLQLAEAPRSQARSPRFTTTQKEKTRKERCCV